MKSNIRIKLLSILYTLALINSTIIKEGYHFFDVFYYRDMYKNYLKQKRNSKCSLDEGPNCLYIKSKNESEIQIELKNIYPEDNNIDKESLESIYLKLKNTTKLYTDKETSTIEDEVFQFDSPYVMTLLLSFESYDEKTNLGDIYAPETIDTPFDLGRVTLTIVGKLRLTQKNSNNFDSTIISKEDLPQKTYAYVESKEVIMKFNLKSTISSLYIKKMSADSCCDDAGCFTFIIVLKSSTKTIGEGLSQYTVFSTMSRRMSLMKGTMLPDDLCGFHKNILKLGPHNDFAMRYCTPAAES
jgi:hypothetical protein